MYEKNIILAIVVVLALSVVAVFFLMNKSPLIPATGAVSAVPNNETQETTNNMSASMNTDKPDESNGTTPISASEPKTISLPSGLQYQDLKVGDGAVAKSGQKVSVNYIGVLTDGTKFDSSFDAGRPFSFDLGAGQVIRGWDEGVAGMKIGGRRILIIPANLGYGSQAVGMIPANSILIFQVDLLDVK